MLPKHVSEVARGAERRVHENDATVMQPGGGEFATVASNWLLWQFKGDKQAKAMFVGAKCQLCTNPKWNVGSKRLTG